MRVSVCGGVGGCVCVICKKTHIRVSSHYGRPLRVPGLLP